jgi:hypothetical protein
MKRRDFLKRSGGLCLSGVAGVALKAEPSQAYPFSTLEEALASVGFDASKKDSFTTIWTADTHYGIGDPENILPPIMTEVRAMKTPPKFFAIAGDLICRASLSFGQVPGEKQKAEAIAEFKVLKRHVDAIEQHVPVKLALGNHDTHPEEDAPELFHAVFPERPEYHAFEIAGVPFIFLNGGSCGNMDEEQRTWFRDEVKRRHKPGATLMVICHQPSLGSVTNERGVPAAFREALNEAKGDLWLIGGHQHHNHDQAYRLPKGIITQATITTGNPGTWGTERPGYWIYAFSGGKLVARVFRRLGQGYAVARPPTTQNATLIRLPFENRDDLLWHVLVGEGDRPYLIDAQAKLCQNYWHYTKSLTYRFPLTLGHGKARRLAVLETHVGGKQPRKYFASADGGQWDEITQLERDGAFTRFPIPANCFDSGSIHIRLEQCTVSGFAFTT